MRYAHSLVWLSIGSDLYGEGVVWVRCRVHVIKRVTADVVEGACLVDSHFLGSYPRPMLVGGVPWPELILLF